jgi:arylsulfatase A-like enzyme
MASLPNILYIHSHDTGRYIQPYGHAVATPNLQRLAEEGVLFRQAFTVNPTCSPSRACLLSGQCAHANGMLGLAHRGFAMNYEHHIVNTLKKHGYVSALAGIQHVASGPNPAEKIGYDRFLGPPPVAHEKAVEFLDNAPQRPFFLAVGFFETHREFPVDTVDDARYTLPPAPLPDTPDTREDMARFKTMARIYDDKVGQVLAALERNGLAENTLVISTTDHGIAFPRMKCNLQDSGTGIMLILRGPGGFSGGKVVDAMVTHMDIFPTVCELAGINTPSWLEGKSLAPIVRDETDHVHEEIFFEVNYHASYEPIRAARTNRWKYIKRYDGRTTPVMPNCDDGLSKDVWAAAGWAERDPQAEQLYDLVFDPNETNNLAADPAHAEVLGDMRGRLEAWMKRTDDPLLEYGYVPAPEGAKVNDPDGFSPRHDPLPVWEYHKHD